MTQTTAPRAIPGRCVMTPQMVAIVTVSMETISVIHRGV